MMRLAIPNGVLTALSTNMSAICSEGRVRLHPADGLKVAATDAANCALVSIEIPADAFLNYDTGAESEVEIGVDVPPLKKLVGLCSSDVVGIVGEPTGPLTFIEGNKKLTMPLLSVDTIRKTPNLPPMPSLVVFEAPGKLLYDTIKDVGSLVDKVYFTCLTDQSVDVTGQECADDEKIRFHWNHGDEITLTTPPANPEVIIGIYSIDYLKDICKSLKGADTVSVAFGTDIPITFSATLEMGVEVLYLVAPRIETS